MSFTDDEASRQKSFSDSDLKRYKSFTHLGCVTAKELKALLARLEAAECVCWAAKLYKDIGCLNQFQYSQMCKAVEAWRKAKGEAG